MKITKKEVKEISLIYSLGKPTRISLIDEGMKNTNILLETDRGEFILRFLRRDANKKYIQEKEFEFRIIKFLEKNKYPYKIPIPLKNNKGKIISNFKKRKYWVYNYIKGEKKQRLNEAQVKEVSKAISKYHKIVSKIKGSKPKSISKLEWVIKKYKKMKKVDRRKNLNKIMIKYLDYFQENLDKIVKINFKGTILPVHADFHQGNIIFSGNKVVGIIDFDNISWSLKNKDIANSMKSVCKTKDNLDNKKVKIYIREYKKYNTLTNKEIKMIKPLMIRNYCIIFWWAYEGELKNEKKRPSMIKYAYRGLKSLDKVIILV